MVVRHLKAGTREADLAVIPEETLEVVAVPEVVVNPVVAPVVMMNFRVAV
jgi:hypothetical protein